MLTTRSVSTLLLGAGLALAATAVRAQEQEMDLDGSWKMTILGSSPLEDKEATLSFEQSGFSLVVSIDGKKEQARAVGYLDGNHVTFYYVKPSKKGEILARFSGHVRGDLMGGELTVGKQAATWKATRGTEPELDLSGSWTLQMKGESPSGLNLVKMSFRQEGHSLVVTLHGENSDVECEGYLAGRIITFFYVRHTETEDFVARFSGQLAGALMGGEVDMGELGKTTWRATQDV